jgi:cytochrome c-type biogenesis protein
MSSFVVDQLMGGYLLAALPFAIFAGIISFLSPCVLPLVPGYLAYAAGFSKSRGRVFLGSILFVAGFSALFISYGALFGGIGSEVFAREELITRILGALTIFLGLLFMGVFPMAPTFHPRIATTGGLIGWTPCIGPALATVQTLAFQESSAARGAILSLGYCIGLGAPFIATGLFLDKSEKLRKFLVRRGDLISKIGGVLLILIGIAQLLGLWSDLMASLRSVISDFAPVI